MKHIIEVNRNDIDHIIMADLMNKYYLNDSNIELQSAIEVILKHYMKPSAYSEWFQTKKTPTVSILDSSYPDGDGYWK